MGLFWLVLMLLVALTLMELALTLMELVLVLLRALALLRAFLRARVLLIMWLLLVLMVWLALARMAWRLVRGKVWRTPQLLLVKQETHKLLVCKVQGLRQVALKTWAIQLQCKFLLQDNCKLQIMPPLRQVQVHRLVQAQLAQTRLRARVFNKLEQHKQMAHNMPHKLLKARRKMLLHMELLQKNQTCHLGIRLAKERLSRRLRLKMRLKLLS